ncbi:MAG: hypothetical protein PHE18_04395 [Candidatus Omnitrophica bacterium]|nr:hypothetical protein [Candidatus Omnitrophota bacterium]MDD5553098.1 hypothetical protein [Candidatus Omnitrophota bacterium]
MNKYIIAVTYGGLCNRIKCLLSSMRLAEKYSKRLALFWPRDPDCNCSFSDLFENKIDEVDRKQLEALACKDGDSRDYEICKTWRLLTLPEDNLPSRFSRVFPSERGGEIDFEYERIPLPVRGEFLKHIKRLAPKRYIADKIEEFSQNFDGSITSINIRTWEKEERRHLFNEGNVWRIIERQEEKSRFFIVCDSPEFVKKIITKYKDRVLYYPRRTYPGDRNSREGIEDALIELYLLSKSDKIKASLWSTFSEMAWWLGGCKAAVEVIPLSPGGYAYAAIYKIKTKLGNKFSQINPSYARTK